MEGVDSLAVRTDKKIRWHQGVSSAKSLHTSAPRITPCCAAAHMLVWSCLPPPARTSNESYPHIWSQVHRMEKTTEHAPHQESHFRMLRRWGKTNCVGKHWFSCLVLRMVTAKKDDDPHLGTLGLWPGSPSKAWTRGRDRTRCPLVAGCCTGLHPYEQMSQITKAKEIQKS